MTADAPASARESASAESMWNTVAHLVAGARFILEGHLTQAIGELDQALRGCPTYAEAWCLKGTALRNVGALTAAYDCFAQAAVLTPSYRDAERALAEIGPAIGRAPKVLTPWEAEPRPRLRARLMRALRRVAGISDKGGPIDALTDLYMRDQLIAAPASAGEAGHCSETYMREQLAAAPDAAEWAAALGSLFVVQYRVVEAEFFLRYAQALAPWSGDVAIGLHTIFDRLPGERWMEPAAKHALAAGGTDPRLGPFAMWYALRLADWADFARLRDKTVRALTSSPLAAKPGMAAHLVDDPLLLKTCAIVHAKRAIKTARRAALRPAGPRKRLTIGYLSPEFYDHAGAQLVPELFELHDRQRFRIVGLSVGPNDKSQVRRRLEGAFDRFVDFERKFTDEALCDIAACELDILVDLSAGHAIGARHDIVLSRPAPVQIGYLGFPGTSGAEALDYALVDKTVVPPEHQDWFTEALIYMPGAYQVNDRKRTPAAPQTRAAYGLPDQGIVFCCLNDVRKFFPETFRSWMRILNAVPGSVLWLLATPPEVRANLTREAGLHGIAASRLVFAGRVKSTEHLARFKVADIALDTWPYGGHTTTSDALWMGCPVVTWAGQAFPGRVAASLVQAAGVPELVMPSPEGYEALAVRLAQDHEHRLSLRRRLEDNRSSSDLFDTPRFTRALEWAFEEIWGRYMRGERPSVLHVPPQPA